MRVKAGRRVAGHCRQEENGECGAMKGMRSDGYDELVQ